MENDFFELPKVKWLHLTGDVDKSVSCLCQIFSGFHLPKSIEIGLFNWIYFLKSNITGNV